MAKKAEAAKPKVVKDPYDLTMDDFTKLTAKYVRAMEVSRKALLQLSFASLTHFAKYGQVAQIRALYEAMPKNRERRASYLKWCQAFSPLAYAVEKDGSMHFFKDKDSDREFDLAGAFQKPFWDFDPPVEEYIWGQGELIAALERVIKKHRDGKHSKAANDDAARFLNRIDEAIHKVAKA